MLNMPVSRRRLLCGAGAAFAGSWMGSAEAQQWKTDRPIRFIVPFPAGGSGDIVVRVLAQAMGNKLGGPIIVDNKAGAGGAIGLQAASVAAPDGHTLVLGGSDTLCIYSKLYSKPLFKAEDLVPVGPIGVIPFVLMARSDLPASTSQEVAALAKNKQLTYASYGTGSASHLSTVVFMRAVGLPVDSMLHVPFQGVAPAAQAVAAGQVDLFFAPVPVVASQRGRVKLVSVLSSKRVEAIAEVPTLAEQGVTVKLEGESWMGVMAPPKTPAAIVNSTAEVLAEAIALPETKTRLASLGIVPSTASPSQYAAFYNEEFNRWGKVIREANIKLD